MKCWLLFLAWLLFVGLLIAAADQGRLPAICHVVRTLPFGDKLGHVVLIGTLAGLLNLAAHGRLARVGPFRWQWGGLLVALIMTLEEVSQLWIPGRTFDLGDLIANYLGVLLAEFACSRPQVRA